LRFRTRTENAVISAPATFDCKTNESLSVTARLTAVSQEHHADGEPDGGAAGVWRGMAQLPSRVPVGLQGSRAGQLPAELQHGVHRRVRASRAGVRPEDGRPASGGQAVPEDGRRFAGRGPPSAPRRHVGMGRRGHGRGRKARRPRYRIVRKPLAVVITRYCTLQHVTTREIANRRLIRSE